MSGDRSRGTGGSEALDGSGHVTAQQLYGPYGAGRYSSGSMPTAKGYMGQYADAASSGLDYYHARYYDAVLGQFASADSAGDGLNRYAYVRDDPETFTDRSGRSRCDETGCSQGHGNHGGGGCTFECSGGEGSGSGGSGHCDGGCNGDAGCTFDCTSNKDVCPTADACSCYPGGSCNASKVSTCNAQCQQGERDDARNNIIVGGLTLFAEVGALIAGCVFGPACGAWLKFLAGPIMKALHSIAAGIEEILSLDGASPIVRMAVSFYMILLDIGGMIVNTLNIFDTSGEIKAVWPALKDIGTFSQKVFAVGAAYFGGGPSSAGFQALIGLKDDLLDIFNIKDLHDDVGTFIEAANEVIGPYGYSIEPY